MPHVPAVAWHGQPAKAPLQVALPSELKEPLQPLASQLWDVAGHVGVGGGVVDVVVLVLVLTTADVDVVVSFVIVVDEVKDLVLVEIVDNLVVDDTGGNPTMAQDG